MEKHYKYAIVSRTSNNIILTNEEDKFTCNHLTNDKLINVDVKIDSNNNLIIKGKELIFDITTELTPLEDLAHMPLKKYIKHYEPGKFARFFGGTPYDYVYGWYCYEDENNVTYILSDYRIKII